MPDKDNLPTIAATWKDFEHRPTENREIVLFDVIGALCAHRFPETVPLLAPFVTHPFAGREVEEALSQIVGKDLGRTPKPWLDRYETHKPPN